LHVVEGWFGELKSIWDLRLTALQEMMEQGNDDDERT
jgi:hypothetical protein